MEDGVHHGLKSTWGVRESEEHDAWFVEPQIGLEGSFPLISIFDSDVIVSPANVEFCE